MSERRPGFLLLIEKMRVRESIRADCPSPSMKSPSRISRRSFLHTAAAASVGAGVFGFPAILRSASPGGKLNIAIIGCGGRGGEDMKAMLGENIVALCDVNAKNLDAAEAKAPGAKKFTDFRQMYDTLKDSEFHAVVLDSDSDHGERRAGKSRCRKDAWHSGADRHAPKQPHERSNSIATTDQPEISFLFPR